MNIQFNGKSFCFTGVMSQLKRSHAEREVRSRLGFTQKIITISLDYLVIGSIPSFGWKFGDYGKKIQAARGLINGQNKNLLLVSEHDFMEALEQFSPVSDGDINKKLLVIKYKSLVRTDHFDENAVETFLSTLQNANCYVTASLEYPNIYQELYHQYQNDDLTNKMYLNIRIVIPMDIGVDSQDIMDDIAIEFEKIKGLDGDISFIEKIEGSASFYGLLTSIPQFINLSPNPLN